MLATKLVRSLLRSTQVLEREIAKRPQYLSARGELARFALPHYAKFDGEEQTCLKRVVCQACPTEHPHS
jgi:hypothetical protein